MMDKTPDDVVLRPAKMADAEEIARIMRAARLSFDWMPDIHTPEEDRGFVRGHLLPISWSRLHKPAAASSASSPCIRIGSSNCISIPRTPDAASAAYCSTRPSLTCRWSIFSASRLNTGARRFYERHGFVAEIFSDGATNDKKLRISATSEGPDWSSPVRTISA